MKPGNYRAKAKLWKLGEWNPGATYLAILFEIQTQDGPISMQYNANFGDEVDKGGKTKTERTTEVLRILGCQDTESWPLVGLDCNDVEVAVDDWTNRAGVTVSRINFVNPLGDLRVKGELSASDAQAFMRSLRAPKDKTAIPVVQRFSVHDASTDERLPF